MLGNVFLLDESTGLGLAESAHHFLKTLSLSNGGLVDDNRLLVRSLLLLFGFDDLISHSA